MLLLKWQETDPWLMLLEFYHYLDLFNRLIDKRLESLLFRFGRITGIRRFLLSHFALLPRFPLARTTVRCDRSGGYPSRHCGPGRPAPQSSPLAGSEPSGCAAFPGSGPGVAASRPGGV